VIVLDTNVVSEAMKASAAPEVLTWLNNQAPETLYLSSVTIAELLFGIAAMPDGKRKAALSAMVEEQVDIYGSRILDFDSDAARHYAELALTAKLKGRAFPTADGYIAAIAAAHGFGIASRDTAPFEAAGIKVINPWTAGQE
jgi:predicted nucleic acid-binding protein